MTENNFPPTSYRIDQTDELDPDKRNKPTKFYAHSREGTPPSDWQEMGEHLRNVAHLAYDYAQKFGGGDWGYLAGLWHDLGREINGFLC